LISGEEGNTRVHEEVLHLDRLSHPEGREAIADTPIAKRQRRLDSIRVSHLDRAVSPGGVLRVEVPIQDAQGDLVLAVEHSSPPHLNGQLPRGYIAEGRGRNPNRIPVYPDVPSGQLVLTVARNFEPCDNGEDVRPLDAIEISPRSS